jgi:hypothetical protein
MNQSKSLRSLTAAAIAPILFAIGSASVYAEALNFTVVNDTEDTLIELYIAPSSDDDWGEDLLGEEELDPGESIEIEIDDDHDECEYDVQAVFDNDGDEEIEEIEEEDLCEQGAVYTLD